MGGGLKPETQKVVAGVKNPVLMMPKSTAFKSQYTLPSGVKVEKKLTPGEVALGAMETPPAYGVPVYPVNGVEPDDKAVMVTAQITEYSDWPDLGEYEAEEGDISFP